MSGAETPPTAASLPAGLPPELAALPADLGLVGVRWLGPGDGARLVALLRACYGGTYSYAGLYDPAQVEARWAEGSLLSIGYVDPTGSLDGHTGFLRKDPKQEYVESALSLIRPGARRGFGVDPGPVWRALLDRWSRATSFIHQNTTTRHPRAQLYATRHLHARPTGWVFDYALDEALVDLAEAPAPMHALTMSTTLLAEPLCPTLAVPQGPWAAWLTAIVRAVLPKARVVPVACADEPASLVLEPVEDNPSLGLRRRVVKGVGHGPAEPRARVDLVHLPMRAPLVRAAWASLLAAGFLPVGVRPHFRRDCEIVLQALDGAHGRAAIETMCLAGARTQNLAQQWSEACVPTS